MSFHCNYLPKSDVVFTVMFLNKELCEKVLEVITGEYIELVDIAAEYKNDLHKAALNSIYFDIKTRAVDGRIVTLDLQRVYSRDRIRNRTIFYACREIASQKVEKSKYENLKSVIVTFILTEASLKHTTFNRKIKLVDQTTGKVYSDLLTIHEINIRHISEKHSQEFQILKQFFEIDAETSYQKFVSSYAQTQLGTLLLEAYDTAVSDPSVLDYLSEEDKYMVRLSEEERLLERAEGRQEGLKEGEQKGLQKGLKEGEQKGLQKGLQEGRQEERIKIAKKLLHQNMDIVFISSITGLTEKEIEFLN